MLKVPAVVVEVIGTLKKNLDACGPSEYPPVRGENVKTCIKYVRIRGRGGCSYTLLYHIPGIINRLYLALNRLIRRKHHTTQRLLVSATWGRESVYIHDARDLKNVDARRKIFKGN